MNGPTLQLLVLAGIALFLVLKLKNVLGTREGFEKPPVQANSQKAANNARRDFEVIEGGADRDITDHVDEGSDVALALNDMKVSDSTFVVSEFLQGARSAYEMILMGFERGDLDAIEPYLSEEVFESFSDVVKDRKKQGLNIEATFIGVRETSLVGAEFDTKSKLGEVSVKFVGELTSVVRDKAGDIIEGNANEVKRQKDIWTFSRTMGEDDPNWLLVATGE